MTLYWKIGSYHIPLVIVLLLPIWNLAHGAELTPLDSPEPTPPLSLPDLGGQTHDLTAFGKGAVVINFWASWCAPCIRELPALEQLDTLLRKQGGGVLAVNSGETRKQIERYLRRHPSQLKILLDQDTAATRTWRIESMPTSLVVGPRGRILARVVGEYPWGDPATAKQILNLR